MSDGKLRPDVLENSYAFVCEWYSPEEVRRAIADDWRMVSRQAHQLPKIPTDHYSQEFADWLCDQYRLAMLKGIDLARSAMQTRLQQQKERGDASE